VHVEQLAAQAPPGKSTATKDSATRTDRKSLLLIPNKSRMQADLLLCSLRIRQQVRGISIFNLATVIPTTYRTDCYLTHVCSPVVYSLRVGFNVVIKFLIKLL